MGVRIVGKLRVPCLARCAANFALQGWAEYPPDMPVLQPCIGGQPPDAGPMSLRRNFA